MGLLISLEFRPKPETLRAKQYSFALSVFLGALQTPNSRDPGQKPTTIASEMLAIGRWVWVSVSCIGTYSYSFGLDKRADPTFAVVSRGDHSDVS